MGWVGAAFVVYAPVAFGQTEPEFEPELMPEAQPGPAPQAKGPPRIKGIHFDYHPGWSVGLEGYAGLAVLSNQDGGHGHALAGGLARLRITHFELGAQIERSDYTTERWRQLGAFAGIVLPYTNWVDFDASLGFARRTYVSTDSRYGDVGVRASVNTLTLRVGVSDRPLDSRLSPRIGGALLLGVDMNRPQARWSYELEGERYAGTTRFGGFSAALAVNLSLDVLVKKGS